jgi:hypothetical protein
MGFRGRLDDLQYYLEKLSWKVGAILLSGAAGPQSL